jgi:hypothetical protein
VEGVGWFRVLAPSPTILSFQTGCDVLALKSGACDLWTIEWEAQEKTAFGVSWLDCRASEESSGIYFLLWASQ